MNATFRFIAFLVSASALFVDVAAVASNATSEVAPEISLSLRGLSDDHALEQGEPLRVAVRLASPKKSSGTIQLAPSAGTWADAVAVELLAAGKNDVIARAQPLGVPEGTSAILDRNHVAGGLWVFSANAMQGMTTGEHVVRVRLKINGGSGWSGETTSEGVRLTIIGISSQPGRIKARTLVRAQLAVAADAFEEAARLLDDVLEGTPDDIELLSLRAEVALRGGNPWAAMMCVNRAARSLSPRASGPPPLMLDEISSRAFAAQLADSSSRTAAPAWTWPPLSVMRALKNDAMMATPGRPESASAIVPVKSAPLPPRTPASVSGVSSAAVPVPAAFEPRQAGTTANGKIVPVAELADPKITSDPAGQWAASASAGTQYGKTQYSAAQATGAPNILVAGNSPAAWCPANKNKGTDWLEVAFAEPVHAGEVRIRQNDTAGAISKIEAIDADGTVHVWWEGVDPYATPAVREIVWFALRVPKTEYLVSRIKITLNLAAMPGWKQIDAVQLVRASQ